MNIIEEAAKAIWIARHADGDLKWGEMAWSELTRPDDWSEEALEAVEQARAAWAVFEQAHTPTDDHPDAEGPWRPWSRETAMPERVQTSRRQAMILEFDDGHREYSPEVEITIRGDEVSVIPIVPFRRTSPEQGDET